MMTTWEAYFDLAQQVEDCALRAGFEKPRATRLAEDIAARPVGRRAAARLLLQFAKRRHEPVKLSLLQHLVARHDRRVMEDITTPAEADATVMAGYRLLSQLEPHHCPPLDLVRVGPTPGAAACLQGLVVINPESDYYRSRDPLQIAMLLFHENWHSVNGSDERAAYAASEAFLERHRR